MTPLVRDWVRNYSSVGGDPAEGMWFDISNALHKSDVPALDLRLKQSRPPFDKCFVACQGKAKNAVSETMLVVVGDDPETGILVTAWVGHNGQKPKRFPTITYLIEDGQIKAGADGEISDYDKQMVLRLLALWYGALSTGTDAYHPTIKRNFTSQRLQSKGKPPQFDWHTVKVEPPKPKQEHQGGTHASPRLHDRRGHLRRFKNGKTCWVKACKVGDASKGVVFKDYEVAE